MISIVIPAYNEEENIPRIKTELIGVLSNLGEDFEIIVVDDGSIDDTSEEVYSLIRDYKNIYLIRHQKNMGIGASLKDGIRTVKGDVLIPLDADFTFHPELIPPLLDTYRQKKADCVTVSPFLMKDHLKHVDPKRLFLTKTINRIYSALLIPNITEINGVFRAYRVDSLRMLKLDSNGFEINAEIIFKMVQHDMRIFEIPGALTKRVYGQSKMRILDATIHHFLLLVKIIGWRLSLLSRYFFF